MTEPNQSEGNRRRFVRMFQDRFAGLVRSGEKRQTIRATPKRMPKGGDLIDCRAWEGKAYRSKQKRLGVFKILFVWNLELMREGVILKCSASQLLIPDLNEFAQADGFKDWDEMVSWFEVGYGLPFKGILIDWIYQETAGPTCIGPDGLYGPNDRAYINQAVREAAQRIRAASEIYSEGHYPHSNARVVPSNHPLRVALAELAKVDKETARYANTEHDPPFSKSTVHHCRRNGDGKAWRA